MSMSSKSKSKTNKPSEVMSLKKADIGKRRGPIRSARKDAASVSQAEADDMNEQTNQKKKTKNQ